MMKLAPLTICLVLYLTIPDPTQNVQPWNLVGQFMVISSRSKATPHQLYSALFRHSGCITVVTTYYLSPALCEGLWTNLDEFGV